jgi:hypothetical protein
VKTLVRAKFKVASKSDFGDAFKVVLSPVYSGSPENQAFFKATPGGSITLEVIGKEVADQFKVNQEFYIDFIPAE